MFQTVCMLTRNEKHLTFFQKPKIFHIRNDVKSELPMIKQNLFNYLLIIWKSDKIDFLSRLMTSRGNTTKFAFSDVLDVDHMAESLCLRLDDSIRLVPIFDTSAVAILKKIKNI